MRRILKLALFVIGLGTLFLSFWLAVVIFSILFLDVLWDLYSAYKDNEEVDILEVAQPHEHPDVTKAFGDTLVKDVMVPRTDMVTVANTFNVRDILDLVLFNGFSRTPVCGEGIDDIQGIAHAKDLMSAVGDTGTNQSIDDIMRKANFVPETKRIADLLREMQANSFHVAIAIDEYGGTAGLVTLEDLIEEIVGEITDEFDVEEPLIERLDDNEFRVNGRVPVGDLSDTLGVEFPTGEWSTVGGFIFTTLGYIPKEGEEVSANDYKFCVERVQGRRIARVLISPNKD